MSLPISQAREQGYSDDEILDFVSKKYPDRSEKIQLAMKEGYSPSDILSFLEKGSPPSKTRSVLSALPKGIIKGSSEIGETIPISPGGPIPKKAEEQILERVLPTREGKLESFLERTGKLLPLVALGPEGLGSKLLQLLGGTAAGELAKREEVGPTGQAISEAVGMGLPALLKSAVSRGLKALSGLYGEEAKMASGLTKPQAVEALHPERGIITPEHQEKAIKKLNEEAAKLATSTLEKEVPLAKEVQEGFDFGKKFEKDFSEVQKLAEKANPQINIAPVENFMLESVEKYRGIPSLHPQGRKVLKEIQSFMRNPQSEMKNLLRIYRSNNKKVSDIFETSRLTGKQKEYTDFLLDMNRSIGKAFEQTLPEGSPWLKQFREANLSFKQYKDAQEALNLLRPILGKEPSPKALETLANDPKRQKKLVMAMGEKGGQEIIQLSRDLQEATKAIKKIPAKNISMMEAVLPLGYFIPGFGKVKALGSIYKGMPWIKRVYGYMLATPVRRNAMKELFSAIKNNDVIAYSKAVQRIQRLLKENESIDQKDRA